MTTKKIREGNVIEHGIPLSMSTFRENNKTITNQSTQLSTQQLPQHMQLQYKNRTLRNIKRPSTPSMSSQNTRFETNEYKCLCSGNCYHPFDTPRLTTTAFAYRSTTVLKHTPYRNSAAFGYPARRHKLGVKLIKLTTTKPPFVVPAELIAEQEPI